MFFASCISLCNGNEYLPFDDATWPIEPQADVPWPSKPSTLDRFFPCTMRQHTAMQALLWRLYRLVLLKVFH